MRKVIAAVFLSAFLFGCGGPVVSSAVFSDPDGISSGGAARVDDFTLQTYGLPIAYFTLAVKPDSDCKETITLGDKAVLVRDPRMNFALHYHHASVTNDSISVETDGAGLLTAINTTSENQTLAIADQAFALAAQVGKLAAAEAPPPKAHATPCALHAVNTILDPLNASQREQLKSKGIVIDPPEAIDGRPTKASDSLPCPSPQSGKGDDRGEMDCIYFRVNRTYRVSIAAGGTTNDFLFTAPDQSATYSIPMVRKDFVKFDVKLTFDHGVLKKIDSTDPSQLLALIQIPGDLIKDILGLDTSSSSSAAAAKK